MTWAYPAQWWPQKPHTRRTRQAESVPRTSSIGRRGCVGRNRRTACTSGLAAGCGHSDDPGCCRRHVRVNPDQGIRLERDQRDALGVTDRAPPRPPRDVPRRAPAHPVVEESELGLGELLVQCERLLLRQVTVLDLLQQQVHDLRPDRGGRHQLMGGGKDPVALRDVEPGLRINHEPGDQPTLGFQVKGRQGWSCTLPWSAG